MTTIIPTEILISILNNLQSSHSTRDLHSSLLVNRNWCLVTIPILWELPLGQECCTDEWRLRKKALCIRTYISCLDTRARNLLTQNGFDLSSSSPHAAFDYPSFTHKFIIENLVYFISIYSQQIIGTDQDNNNNNYNNNINDNESRKLFREICKLIINRCSFLDYFKLAKVTENFSRNFDNYSDSIGSILKLPVAPKVFKKLETFISGANDELFRPLYELLALICNNILNMELRINSHSHYQVQLLAKLISVQKRLENLSIIDNSYTDCNSLFGAIISQKETLKSLRLKKLYYNRNVEKLPTIGQFTSLQELYIENCYGLHNSDCLSFASSFTQLNSFHYLHSSHSDKYPQGFIIKILETANTNLRNLYLELYPTTTFDIFSTILNYCTKVTELSLHKLRPEQIISIFNNFNELKRFSFDCRRGFNDADELLFQMSENVPESLETIEIRMDYYNTWTFSANSLRIFFEGWYCKGGEGNKKMIIKRTEQAWLFKLSDEHFKVIEEYGVQFDMEITISNNIFE